MTCIVGITDGHTVTIGGDSAGSDGWHVAVRSDSKVFQVGPYLMGFTTSYRMGHSCGTPLPSASRTRGTSIASWRRRSSTRYGSA